MPIDEAKLNRITSELRQVYPGNKQEEIRKPRAVKQRKTFFERVKNSFLSGMDPEESLFEYLLYDIFIPESKDIISNIVKGGIDMCLFGGHRAPRSHAFKRDRDRTYVSYSKYYTGERDRFEEKRELTRSQKARHDFDEVVFVTLQEAKDVLSKLLNRIEEYGVVSVADFYELCSVDSDYPDHKYGWKNLENVFIDRIRKGYVIVLPQPRPLD